MKLYTIVSWNKAKHPHEPTWKICDSWGKAIITEDEMTARAFKISFEANCPTEEFKIMEMTEYLT